MTAAEKIVRALAAEEPLVETDWGDICGLCDTCETGLGWDNSCEPRRMHPCARLCHPAHRSRLDR